MQGRHCFTDLAKIYLKMFSIFKKQEMEENNTGKLPSDQIMVSILNDTRKFGVAL